MMPGFTDRDHLKNVQYKDASNLQARGNLHARFGTSPVGWLQWYFRHLLSLPSSVHILEVGCGPGWIWQENASRIPPGWHVTLTDLTAGMIGQARENLAATNRDFTFAEVDVQELPFPDESYDAVIANHMLYHVPDLPRGLDQIRRVLKPGGHFFAATNGREHMKELREIAHEVYAVIPPERTTSFGLEEGAQDLAPYFTDIEMHPFDNQLHVTDADALKGYIRSMQMAQQTGQDAVDAIERRIDEQMERDGFIDIGTRAGVFIARKPAT
jgi:ubiquinone/menaquinone biosynthesis C-methylase UbiE